MLTNGEPDGLLHGEAAVAAAGVVHEEEDEGDEGGRAQYGHPQLQGEGHHELQQHAGSSLHGTSFNRVQFKVLAAAGSYVLCTRSRPLVFT